MYECRSSYGLFRVLIFSEFVLLCVFLRVFNCILYIIILHRVGVIITDFYFLGKCLNACKVACLFFCVYVIIRIICSARKRTTANILCICFCFFPLKFQIYMNKNDNNNFSNVPIRLNQTTNVICFIFIWNQKLHVCRVYVCIWVCVPVFDFVLYLI